MLLCVSVYCLVLTSFFLSFLLHTVANKETYIGNAVMHNMASLVKAGHAVTAGKDY